MNITAYRLTDGEWEVTDTIENMILVEGSVNTYEWIKSQTVEANKEIPVYGMVRVRGETAKEFSLEDFKNQKDYDEGIVFTVSLR